jgi:hypothetical protein
MASQFIQLTFAVPTSYCGGGGRIMAVIKRMEMARKERWLKEGTI